MADSRSSSEEPSSRMEPQYPYHEVIDVDFIDDDTATLALMCKRTCIHISVNLSDLRGSDKDATNTLIEEFLHFRDHFDDDFDIVGAFEDWAITPCLPYVLNAGSQEDGTSRFTLGQYFNPDKILLELFVENDKLHARRCTGDFPKIRRIATKVHPSELINVQQTRLESWPRIKASEVDIIPDNRMKYQDDEYVVMPKLVRHAEIIGALFFKKSRDAESLSRELQVYTRFTRCKAGLPALRALVVWDEPGNPIMGFLTDYIPNKGTLCDFVSENPTHDLGEKWMGQITEAVNLLHEEGLLWGNCSSENVLVDHNDNARVFNFGCPWFKSWADAGKGATKERDLQGLKEIGDFLGPQDRNSVTEASGEW